MKNCNFFSICLVYLLVNYKSKEQKSMKKVLLAMIFFVCTFSVTSQTKQIPDFSGKWELDIQKSKLDNARIRIETITINVSQTQLELKVETNVKHKTTDNQSGMMGNRGGMGLGVMTDASFTYSLDGKETKTSQETPFGNLPVTLKAKFDEKESKLKLTQTRRINSPMGEITIVLKETWQLSQDGKTLTIKREIETPISSNVSELVFLKKE